MELFINGKQAVKGQELTDFRGDKAILTGWGEPHKASSSGRVYVQHIGREGKSEYFPGVFGGEFKKSKAELLKEIVVRAERLKLVKNDRITLFMDLEHTDKLFNLRLEDLLDSDANDFIHDIAGIQQNLNRVTKKMGNHFVPRFAGDDVPVKVAGIYAIILSGDWTDYNVENESQAEIIREYRDFLLQNTTCEDISISHNSSYEKWYFDNEDMDESEKHDIKNDLWEIFSAGRNE